MRIPVLALLLPLLLVTLGCNRDARNYQKAQQANTVEAYEGFVQKHVDEDKYTCILDRDNSDYVYLVKDLISLSGNKYHRKKNHHGSTGFHEATHKKHYAYDHQTDQDWILRYGKQEGGDLLWGALIGENPGEYGGSRKNQGH